MLCAGSTAYHARFTVHVPSACSQTKRDEDESDSEEESAPVDVPAMLRVVLALVRPGETPAGALQRLSGKRKPAAKRKAGQAKGLGVQPSEVPTLGVKKLKRVLNSLGIKHFNVVEIEELRDLARKVGGPRELCGQQVSTRSSLLPLARSPVPTYPGP